MVHESGSLKVFGYLLAHIHAVLSHIEAGSLRECAVWVEYVYRLEIVCLAECVVVDIVCWCDLQTACTELYVYVAVLDYGNDASDKRHNHLVSLQPVVLDILGVDTHGCVAHDCLRTCCGHDGIVSALVLMRHLAFLACQDDRVCLLVGDVILQMVQL